jgi:flagellar hook-basal body complex protein FliE
MIDPVSAQAALNATQRVAPGADGMPIGPLSLGLPADGADASSRSGRTSFGELIGDLVQSVDAKGRAAESEARHLMLGESDNIHRSMIAMQEAGVAFTLLVEVRNKLVESYQELMRMPV